jgi:hypothetical protein
MRLSKVNLQPTGKENCQPQFKLEADRQRKMSTTIQMQYAILIHIWDLAGINIMQAKWGTLKSTLTFLYTFGTDCRTK